MITIQLNPNSNKSYWNNAQCENLFKIEDENPPFIYDLINHEFFKISYFILEPFGKVQLANSQEQYYFISLNEGNFIAKFCNGDVLLCISDKGEKIRFKSLSECSSIKNVSNEILIMAVIQKKQNFEIENFTEFSAKRLKFSMN